MHELGIIVHVMRTVEEIAAENNLTEIRSVTCEIGEVSGVVQEYMIDCWGYARPGVTMCEDCGKTYSTVQYAKICPHCGSSATYLLEGNGFSIKEIEGA